MWQVKKVDNGWIVEHSSGKGNNDFIFRSEVSAKTTADTYNSSNLGFCPDCNITQYNSRICSLCAQSKLEKQGTSILKGRFAKCYCNKSVESEKAATEKQYAFFQYNPNSDHDIWYCGCRGWD